MAGEHRTPIDAVSRPPLCQRSDGALASAKKSYQRTFDFLDKYEKAPAYAGEDAQLKASLIEAGRTQSRVLERAAAALAQDDADTYSKINSKELTPTGAAFSAELEKYQKLSDDQIEDLMANDAREYSMVMWLVALGLAAALALVVGVHLLLKSIVLRPLERAVVLLDQVAHGDLTADISESGDNEIKRLLMAIRRMQQDLLSTVSRVRRGAELINTGSAALPLVVTGAPGCAPALAGGGWRWPEQGLTGFVRLVEQC